MIFLRFSQDEFEKLKNHLVLYRCVMKDMQTRVDVLQEDFNNLKQYNPIEHVKTRLKTPESIARKLNSRGIALTADDARQHLTDIAGIRCICSYAKDISDLAEIFKRQPDIKLLAEKDYVTNPKPSGYRSHHLILNVPVHLTDRTEHLAVELQIRTQAMDFWATLEHKARYKYNDAMPLHISQALEKCAQEIADLDERMYEIQRSVSLEI